MDSVNIGWVVGSTNRQDKEGENPSPWGYVLPTLVLQCSGRSVTLMGFGTIIEGESEEKRGETQGHTPKKRGTEGLLNTGVNL